MGGRVEDRRVPVGVGERLGQRAGRQPLELAEDAADGLLVEVRVGRLAEQVLAPQHLEEVELDVPQVALVVTHRCSAISGPHHRAVSPSGGTAIYATR